MQQLMSDKINEYGTTFILSDGVGWYDIETGEKVSSPRYSSVSGDNINPDTGNIVEEKEEYKTIKGLVITSSNEYNIKVTDAETVAYFEGDLDVEIGDTISGMEITSIEKEMYQDEIITKLIRLNK